MPPTLYNKGVLVPLNNKVKKEDLDDYIAIHYILAVINHKRSKPNPNYHDHLFLLKSQTGTGKSTSFVTETFRRFLGKNYGKFQGEAKEKVESFARNIDADLSIYDFPDDKYTINNRANGFDNIMKKKRTILCTQPKILTAVSKAKEIAAAPYNPDLELSVNVGYKTSVYKRSFSDEKGILFSTLGSLVQSIKMKPASDIMEKYDIIMIDECHIRSIDLDLATLLIRQFIRNNAGNPNCPLFVFMSATFDVDKYARYLETPEVNSVLVIGTVSKYEIMYYDEYLDKIGDTTNKDKTSKNYVIDTVNMVKYLHENNLDDKPEEADILVFVPALGGTGRKIMEALNNYNKERNGELIIYSLDGNVVKSRPTAVALIETMKLAEVKEIEKQPNAIRRVTLSTSVAETGITIKALKYVIDIGFNKSSQYSPNHRLPQLVVKNVVRSAMEQRLGRVGRDFYGYAYTMYPKHIMNKLPEYDLPETYTSDPSKLVLDSMYSHIPMSFINDSLEYEQFVSFTSECISPDSPKPKKTNKQCKRIYSNFILEKSSTKNVASYFTDENEKIYSLNDNPPELLDNIPQDLFISVRSNLIRLGMYGTFAGYLASKMPRIDIEGCRMILSSYAYGVSLSDAATMSIIASNDRIRYKVEFMDVKKDKKLRMFNIYNIIKILVSETDINKYFFGSIKKFISVLRDDIIEALIVMKYIIHLCRTIKDKDVAKYKPIYQFEKYSKKSKLALISQKCMDVGIKLNEFRYILSDRISIIQTCEELGLSNVHPDIELDKNIIESISRLKRVIYAGYKNNLLINNGGSLYTSTGLKIEAEKKAKQYNRLLYIKLFMTENPQSMLYKTTVSMYSSLDNWIS